MSVFFETIAKYVKDVKTASKWIVGDFLAILNKNNKNISESNISSEDLIDLFKNLEENNISNPAAKKILEVLWDQDLTVQEIIKKENLEQISNEDELLKIIMKIIEENPKQHNQYKSGKDKLFGFFVGQVMKETQGSADPKVVNEILRKELNQ